MAEVDSMSFASSYVLASRVRSKLTKQAADPKSSLRSLVLQANMLDNIMDHISSKTEQMKHEKSVSFATPEVVKHKSQPAIDMTHGPSITEYEVDSDSDSDFDSDSDSEEDVPVYSSGEDEDDYSFSSEEDEEEEEDQIASQYLYARRKTMPVIDLSDDHQLSVIYEENEEAVPELTRSISSSDSDSEDEMHMPNYILSTAHDNQSTDSLLGTSSPAKSKATNAIQLHHHERHNAICSMDSVF